MTAERFDHTVTTTCGYCGVGCRLEAHADQGRIRSIAPALDGPANEGHTCLKGRFAHQFTRSRDRLTSPLIREGGQLRVASWSEALQRIVSELTRIRVAHGPDAIAGLASSRATNEDCYAMARLMRAAIGTNNIDNCSRVCHSPTSFALRKQRFGLSGATGSFTDIDHADVAVLIGVNPTQGHPVVGARIKQAALRGLQARHDRPAPDRARRLRGAASRAASRHQRRGRARPGARRSPRRAHRRGLHRAAHRRLSTSFAGLIESYDPGGAGDHGRPRRAISSTPLTSTARRPTRLACCGGSASPSTSTARRSSSCSARWR
jgi:hypothetical protein